MSDRPPPARPAATETILFLLIPDFSMIAFTSAIEPLRIANRLSGQATLRVAAASRATAAPVRCQQRHRASRSTCRDPAHEPPATGVLPAVVLCGGLGSEHYQNKEVFAWLRRWDRRGAADRRLVHRRPRAGPRRPARRLPLHDPLGEPAGLRRGVSRDPGHAPTCTRSTATASPARAAPRRST